MTKKHFELFAKLVKADLDETATRWPEQNAKMREAAMYAAGTFARVAESTNPGFDRQRFMLACGLQF